MKGPLIQKDINIKGKKRESVGSRYTLIHAINFFFI